MLLINLLLAILLYGQDYTENLRRSIAIETQELEKISTAPNQDILEKINLITDNLYSGVEKNIPSDILLAYLKLINLANIKLNTRYTIDIEEILKVHPVNLFSEIEPTTTLTILKEIFTNLKYSSSATKQYTQLNYLITSTIERVILVLENEININNNSLKPLFSVLFALEEKIVYSKYIPTNFKDLFYEINQLIYSKGGVPSLYFIKNELFISTKTFNYSLAVSFLVLLKNNYLDVNIASEYNHLLEALNNDAKYTNHLIPFLKGEGLQNTFITGLIDTSTLSENNPHLILTVLEHRIDLGVGIYEILEIPNIYLLHTDNRFLFLKPGLINESTIRASSTSLISPNTIFKNNQLRFNYESGKLTIPQNLVRALNNSSRGSGK